MVFLSEEEVFGRFHRPWHSPRARSRSLVYDPSHFKPGDFVVHVSHGIGRYMGMRVLDIERSRTECLDIRYEGDDRLFIPVSQLRMVEKYTAAEGAQPSLARLGSGVWNRAREKARKSAGLIAQDLIEIYAARQMTDGFAFGPDKPWQKEMEASFPWEETPHQLQASSEVKADMENLRPMDRLLCGDVGFGKTEVAVRAAFKAVLAGRQAAVLVPTTVLALQHYNTFRERLTGFPVNIGMLSRFVSAAEGKKVVEGVVDGKIDILIGTHRLLSKDIKFAELGLVVVDEEHRFGVAQKERLKKMKKTVDVLSMTATPIPRTLSMAISGIRDISVIDTPPRNRLPIHTEILPFDDESIREAVMREIGRGGQVFFVHNRVQSIEVMEGYLAQASARPGEDRPRPRADERAGSRADNDRFRREEVRRPSQHDDNRGGARFPQRQHDHNKPVRQVRPRSALPAQGARRALGQESLRLPSDPEGGRGDLHRDQAPPGDHRIRLSRRRLPDSDEGPRDPRGG